MPFKKLAVTAVVLMLCVVAQRAAYQTYGPHGELSKPQTASSRSKGRLTAPLWITEYMDYECAACARVTPQMDRYMADHPGRIYLQVKFHPMAGHRHAEQAALYAECASRQKAFWPFHEMTLARQAEWAAAEDAAPFFRLYADGSAMDMAELDRCLADPAAAAVVSAEKAEARQLGVKGTPSFFIDGKLAVGEKEFNAAMAAVLEKKGDK